MSAELAQARNEDERHTDAESLAATDGEVGIRESQSSMDARGPRGW